MDESEVLSLNLSDLDVADLERRLELAATVMPAGCGGRCDVCAVEW